MLDRSWKADLYTMDRDRTIALISVLQKRTDPEAREKLALARDWLRDLEHRS